MNRSYFRTFSSAGRLELPVVGSCLGSDVLRAPHGGQQRGGDDANAAPARLPRGARNTSAKNYGCMRKAMARSAQSFGRPGPEASRGRYAPLHASTRLHTPPHDRDQSDVDRNQVYLHLGALCTGPEVRPCAAQVPAPHAPCARRRCGASARGEVCREVREAGRASASGAASAVAARVRVRRPAAAAGVAGGVGVSFAACITACICQPRVQSVPLLQRRLIARAQNPRILAARPAHASGRHPRTCTSTGTQWSRVVWSRACERFCACAHRAAQRVLP